QATPGVRMMSAFSSPKRRTTPRRPRARASARPLSGSRIRTLIGAIATLEESGADGTLDLGGDERLDGTNLDPRFFPKPGYTKGDLLAYYVSVSPFLLPAIADRPLVMKRFPHGIAGQSFYQQRAPEMAPAGVRIEPVSDDGLKTQPRIIGGDLLTLLYIVQ